MRDEADFGLTSMAFGKENPNDDKLMVRFEMFPHPDSDASEAQGRPMFKDREYITIIVPGDKSSIIHRPVWSQDIQRFPRQYQAFKAATSQEAVEGTLLSAWGPLSKSQVLELNYYNVRTVEQLAGLSDANAQKFPGIQKLRKSAQDFLAAAKDASHITRMNQELEKRDNALEVANRTLATVMARLEALEAERAEAE